MDPQGLNLTLLRSPYAAHVGPAPADTRPDHPVTDQGLHEIELVICPGFNGDLDLIRRLARRMSAPPILWDLTG